MMRIGGLAGVLSGLVMVAAGRVLAQAGAGTEPPKGEEPLLTVTGRGVQVYACKVTAGAAAWTFVAPEAKLLDAAGAEVGSHGAGPVWRLRDGSSVMGDVVAKAPGASGGDIPWLLLLVKSHGGEAGRLAGAEYVRRSDTAGGTAPAEGCDAGHAGAVRRVPYTATYTFYARGSAR